MTKVIIEAEWDSKFGEREPHTNAIFLTAGEECLGYVSKSHNGLYMACVGKGIEAPVVCLSADLTECTRAVEGCYTMNATSTTKGTR